MRLTAPLSGILEWLQQLQAKGYTFVRDVPEQQDEDVPVGAARPKAEGQMLAPSRANVFQQGDVHE